LTLESELARAFDEDVLERYGKRFVALLQASGVVTPEVRRALDLNCDTGYATLPLADSLAVTAQVVAISDDRFRLKQLHQKLSAPIRRRIFPHKEGFRRLPFADGTFDAVWGSFPDRRAEPLKPLLRQMFRVLAPGGRLALCLPVHGSFIELIHACGGASGEGGLQELMASAPQLPTVEGLCQALERQGAAEVVAAQESFVLAVAPPAGEDRLVARHLAPLWLKNSREAPARLDEAVREPMEVRVQLACVTARRDRPLDDTTP